MFFRSYGESKSGLNVKYVAVPGDVEAGGDLAQRDAVRIRQQKPTTERPWRVYGILCGLATLALIIALTVVGQARQPALRGRSSKEDPFADWGKPGTGTEGLAWYPTDFLRDVVPVPCHSHNDYWRKVPLFSAIYAGCTGVEADVWLRNGDLLVGHDTASLQSNRTFQSLYINPLVDILTRQNPKTEFYDGTNNGVFDTDPSQTLVLLVDLKTGGAETWPWVMEQLAPLRERGWLSYVENDQFHRRPITVVGTGNTPFDQIIANSTYRDAFFDAPLDRLEDSAFNSTNSYYASTSFWKAIGAVWWKGSPTDKQLEKIRSHLREAHNRGLKARYWELPPWPIHVRNNIWKVLVEEGIDMLNVDDLHAATREDWTAPGTF
ncbi:Altered inheritance of mitochondria protein 6 [Madurella fahalii]|uniref:Altered inheritance of mitochondria protein 6 n=1 Tax=Madurella fahalii TaxID=1157608 RepID=A0ABQ0G8Q4_9PEZI